MPFSLNFLIARDNAYKHFACRQKFLCANGLSANGTSAKDTLINL